MSELPDILDTLVAEHRVIERLLDTLQGFARRLAADASLPRSELAELLRLTVDISDHWHHAKEEGVLFPAMVEAGFPPDDGPIAVMLAQHDEGRGLVGELRAIAAAESASWSADERIRVGAVADRFASMLRAHIRIEDQVLYPAARSHLTPAAFSAICQRAVELDAAVDAERAKARALADDYVRRYAAR